MVVSVLRVKGYGLGQGLQGYLTNKKTHPWELLQGVPLQRYLAWPPSTLEGGLILQLPGCEPHIFLAVTGAKA